jgi:hypothetical protein
MESMELNVGTIDRLIRAGIGIIILLVLVKGGRVSLLKALSLVAGGMLLSSANSGVCPLYTQLGISTKKQF